MINPVRIRLYIKYGQLARCRINEIPILIVRDSDRTEQHIGRRQPLASAHGHILRVIVQGLERDRLPIR